MKIACTGPNGRVGRLLVEKHGVVPLHADITNVDAVEAELDEVNPQVVLHLAGISNVDYCEDKSNWQNVIRVNYTGALNVIRACRDRYIEVGYLSSEHVFSGKHFLWWGGGPYSETRLPDRYVPNSYALTKLAVEGLRYANPNMKVVRTSYLFDWVRLMTEDMNLVGMDGIPTFIRRSYIYLPHFVSNLYKYAVRIALMPNVLHLAGSETVSQYQFMKEFCEYFHVTHTNVKRRTKEINRSGVAPRPHHAGLDVSLSARLGFPQYSYRDGFRQMEQDNVRG